MESLSVLCFFHSTKGRENGSCDAVVVYVLESIGIHIF